MSARGAGRAKGAGGTDLARLLAGPVLEVAPRLLGATLRRTSADGTVAVRLTEVEAYAGADDPGSHAYRGRTPRTATMFGPPGRLYVYFTYGMHHCCNVVVGEEGTASAVLLRAGEVVEGVDLARARRSLPDGRVPADRDLARGPARLCRALAIDGDDDGAPLDGSILLLPRGDDEDGTPGEVAAGPRVGLRHAAERPWRFWLAGEPSVSSYRPAAPPRGAARGGARGGARGTARGDRSSRGSGPAVGHSDRPPQEA